MIIQFSIRNFGPIKDTVTLDCQATSSDFLEDYYIVEQVPGLRILKLAVIYGPNASGKSTVLNALQFLRRLALQPREKKTDSLNYEPFLLDDTSKIETTTLSVLFLAGNVRYNYVVEFTRHYIVSEKLTYYPKGRAAEFYTRSTNIEKQLSSIEFGSTIKLSSKDLASLEGNTLWNNTVLAAFTKTNIDSVELKQVVDWFTDTLLPIINPSINVFDWTKSRIEEDEQMKRDVSELMRKADVQISDWEVVTTQHQMDDKMEEIIRLLDLKHEIVEKELKSKSFETKDLIFHHAVKNKDKQFVGNLPENVQSRGTLRYFGLSGVLSTLLNTQKILAIDEIETSLHPDLMKHYILLFLANSKSSQLFIATHNISFLDEKEILRPDAIWFTEKQEDGSTQLYSLKDFDSSVYRKGASIINSYKIGNLGAKPNLGNIFLTTEDVTK